MHFGSVSPLPSVKECRFSLIERWTHVDEALFLFFLSSHIFSSPLNRDWSFVSSSCLLREESIDTQLPIDPMNLSVKMNSHQNISIIQMIFFSLKPNEVKKKREYFEIFMFRRFCSFFQRKSRSKIENPIYFSSFIHSNSNNQNEENEKNLTEDSLSEHFCQRDVTKKKKCFVLTFVFLLLRRFENFRWKTKKNSVMISIDFVNFICWPWLISSVDIWFIERMRIFENFFEKKFDVQQNSSMKFCIFFIHRRFFILIITLDKLKPIRR